MDTTIRTTGEPMVPNCLEVIGRPQAGLWICGRSALMSLGAATLSGLALSAPAQAFNLGPAQDYNLFVLGDMKAHSSDVEGRVAVGGDLTLDNFNIGEALPNSPTPNLVVGGSLNFSHGTIRGAATYGQTASINNATVGTLTQKNNSSFFSQASQALNQISSNLMGLSDNSGDVHNVKNGGLTLQGGDLNLNVFNLSGIDWASVSYLNIEAPSTSQVLVNIAGKSVKWSGMGFGLTGGIVGQNVLYNLYDATSLEASNIGIKGSILATQASFLGYSGQYNGQGIFRKVLDAPNQPSIQGNEFPNNPSDPTAVPSPSLLGGLVSLGLATWRKRRQAAKAA
jgi:choice-of-anchor A domain-containing protein